MALELGTHPKPTQIAEALVNVYGYGAWAPAYGLEGMFGGLIRVQNSIVTLFRSLMPNGFEGS